MWSGRQRKGGGRIVGYAEGLLELYDLGEDVDGGLEEVTDLEFVV